MEMPGALHVRRGRIFPWSTSGTTRKPSKPSACRSKTLTPTPEACGILRGRCRRRTWRSCGAASTPSTGRLRSVFAESLRPGYRVPMTSLRPTRDSPGARGVPLLMSEWRGDASTSSRLRSATTSTRATRCRASPAARAGQDERSLSWTSPKLCRRAAGGQDHPCDARTGSSRRPSKPWGCRSKTLTPTPEPAGYCAGDVAGERGGRRGPLPRFNRRDMTGLLDLLDPEVEWVPVLAVLEGRVYHGHDAVRRWVEDLGSDWEFFEVSYEEMRDLGDRVLVFGHWRARGRPAGASRSSPAHGSTRSREARSCGCRPSPTGTKPSQRWASRSRRCRRRTWRSCAESMRRLAVGDRDYGRPCASYDPDVVMVAPAGLAGERAVRRDARAVIRQLTRLHGGPGATQTHGSSEGVDRRRLR